MIAVSDAWKAQHNNTLVSKGYVEISCALTEVGAQEKATAVAADEAVFSNVGAITGTSGEQTERKYATLEPNLWLLDGTRNILPSSGPYTNTGYVSDTTGGGSVTLGFPEVRTATIPGLTITWCSEYGEYPHSFTVTARNGADIVAETTVVDNTTEKTLVNLNIAGYDSITVTVNDWCFPTHRSRIELVQLGLEVTFTGTDLLSFKHSQHGCIISGELPKNSISFSLNNLDGRWNPNNPTGMEQYLSERQRITARYGLDVGDKIEWIKAGTFYLSEWRAEANGLGATFVARDMLEFMLNKAYTGITSGTLLDIAQAAVKQADLPTGTEVTFDSSLGNYTVMSFGEHYGQGDYTIAEILQMCANAARCVLYQDRFGVLRIERLSPASSLYEISSRIAYSWPEIELSKIMREVVVKYNGEDKYRLTVNSTGEAQSVNNPLIGSATQAVNVATWVKDNLKNRQTVRGKYRADPRVDLFDCVSIDSKFGGLSMVLLTDIEYTFSGAFIGEYAGRVITDYDPQCGEIYCGEVSW